MSKLPVVFQQLCDLLPTTGLVPSEPTPPLAVLSFFYKACTGRYTIGNIIVVFGEKELLRADVAAGE
jgi:hypothetical protein